MAFSINSVIERLKEGWFTKEDSLLVQQPLLHMKIKNPNMLHLISYFLNNEYKVSGSSYASPEPHFYSIFLAHNYMNKN